MTTPLPVPLWCSAGIRTQNSEEKALKNKETELKYQEEEKVQEEEAKSAAMVERPPSQKFADTSWRI